MSTKHILFVDNNSALRLTYRVVLSRCGYQVTEAPNGKEALDQLLKPHVNIDLIVLDIYMPGLDGFDFIDVLDKHHIKIPIVVITGDVTVQFSQALKNRGCKNIVYKPFGKKELLDSISVNLCN